MIMHNEPCFMSKKLMKLAQLLRINVKQHTDASDGTDGIDRDLEGAVQTPDVVIGSC